MTHQHGGWRYKHPASPQREKLSNEPRPAVVSESTPPARIRQVAEISGIPKRKDSATGITRCMFYPDRSSGVSLAEQGSSGGDVCDRQPCRYPGQPPPGGGRQKGKCQRWGLQQLTHSTPTAPLSARPCPTCAACPRSHRLPKTAVQPACPPLTRWLCPKRLQPGYGPRRDSSRSPARKIAFWLCISPG